MKEGIVLFETALLARDKGFINGSDFYYDINTEFLYVWNDMIGSHGCKNGDYGIHIEAPKQSLLQKWIREVYNIHLTIKYKGYEDVNKYEVSVYDGEYYQYSEIYSTYEIALEAGLLVALNLIN